jgi:outer membrane beta-barrel protein
MKSRTTILLALGLALAATAFAIHAQAGLSHDLEDLGSNKEVNHEVARLDTRSRVSIVQDRTVKREWRLELGGNFGPVAAGDSYLLTQNLGAQVDLHINPKFSLGIRYAKAFNALTPEGKSQFDQAQAAKLSGSLDYSHPEIDYPEQSVLGVMNWYMLYGKINFFDIRVVQFDIYSLLGAGRVDLAMGPSTTWTGGAGIAFWLSQHISSRIELRYQTYADHLESGGRRLNLAVANFGLGVLL